MLRRLRAYLGMLQGNARVCILCHPFWSVPFTLYYYYLSLYLKEEGLSDAQIGSLMVAGTVASLLFSLVAAPLTDRLGRRNTTLMFDLLSSALPPLLYLLSSSFWMALLATVLFNSNKIMSVSYYLVMIEDADDRQKTVAFNLFNLITCAAGLLIPLAGLWVSAQGVTRAERAFLLASFVIMTGMILLRHSFLMETREGEARMKRVKGSGQGALRALVSSYADSLRFLAAHRGVLYILLANVFFFAYMMLGTNQSLYFALYFSGRFRLDSSGLSFLGGLYSAGMLLAMALINPLIRLSRLFFSLKVGLALTLAGVLLLLLLPQSAGFWLVIPVLLLSVSYGTLKTGLDSAMAIYSRGEARSGLYALTNLLSALTGMAAAAYVSAHFDSSANALYQACLVLGALVAAFVWLAGKHQEGSGRKPA
jgi:MFS family permease